MCIRDRSDAIAHSGEAHIPTTKVHGAVSLRACFLHYENREEDVHHLVALVRKFGDMMLKATPNDTGTHPAS